MPDMSPSRNGMEMRMDVLIDEVRALRGAVEAMSKPAPKAPPEEEDGAGERFLEEPLPPPSKRGKRRRKDGAKRTEPEHGE